MTEKMTDKQHEMVHDLAQALCKDYMVLLREKGVIAAMVLEDDPDRIAGAMLMPLVLRYMAVTFAASSIVNMQPGTGRESVNRTMGLIMEEIDELDDEELHKSFGSTG